jgi:membrane protease YdiL (CAAX protease family)
MFGLVHLTNLLGVRYQPLYIALQVGLGILLGAFYSLRFVLSGTLWQSIVMHATNNFYSSFVPLDLQLDLTNPLIAIPRQTHSAHTRRIHLSPLWWALRLMALHFAVLLCLRSQCCRRWWCTPY